jgi:transcriptional regulator with XRE-family HTH domain
MFCRLTPWQPTEDGMSSEAFVQLAVEKLKCSQKELAVRLGVSPTQVTKWKNGEYMSFEFERKFREIMQIGDRLPEFVLAAGSLDEAVKWEKLIEQLAEQAEDENESGYTAAPLSDTPELLCWNVFDILSKIGIGIPRNFPEELNLKFDSVDDRDLEITYEVLRANIYSKTIGDIFKSFTNVYGFYAANISELLFDDTLDLDMTDATNIEPCLLNLAATKIEIDPTIASKFSRFSYETRRDYKSWLELVKNRAFRAGVPLKVELLGLVYETHDDLGQEAEATALGLNSTRLHPDVYMNELLCGMRAIHQVLPAILKKLEIDQEFKLDTSEFFVDK